MRFPTVGADAHIRPFADVRKESPMKKKLQAALGGVLLAATTVVCYQLVKWSGDKIKQRQEKKKQ